MNHPPAPHLAEGLRSPFLARLVATLVLFNALLVAFVGVILHGSHARSEEEARVATKNLAQVLDQGLSGMIREADLGLLAVRDEYEKQLASGGVDETAVGNFLVRQFGYLPLLDSLRIADSFGVVKYGLAVDPNARVSIADRDYFVRLRDDPAAGLVFSKPVVGRISRKWVVIIARRLNHPDGSFAGIVYGPIPVDTLAQVFAKVELGQGSAISLRNDNLELIARHPTLGPPEQTLGKKQTPRELDRLFEPEAPEATHFVPVSTDTTPRIVTYRKVGSYPLYVFVGIARNKYLERWENDVVKASLVALLSLFATTASGIALYRTRRRENETAATLAKQEQKYRIVADNTYDWEFWLAPDGTFLYSSPSCKLWTGYDDSEFYADPDLLKRIIHPDDRALFDAHQRVSRDDTRRARTVIFRIVRADKSVRWMEHTCHPVSDAEGHYLGVRGNNRDITERLHAEQESRYLFDIIERSLNEIYVFDADTLKFRQVNHGALANLQYSMAEMANMTPADIKPEFTLESFRELLEPLRDNSQDVAIIQTVHQRADHSTYPVEVHLQLVDAGGEQVFLAVIFDITARRQAEQAREEALARVRTLEGIIPICMYCKKIRDNQNTWSRIEQYISEHSEAKFSHGICPVCYEAHRSELE